MLTAARTFWILYEVFIGGGGQQTTTIITADQNMCLVAPSPISHCNFSPTSLF